MPLTVTPGVLRSEGPGFDPARDLKRFVETTEFTDLDSDNFAENVNFITVATDAPATAERTDGMLWFKCGEGRLYQWETSFYNPVSGEPEEAQYSGSGMWLARSDRRELIGRTRVFGAFVDNGYIRHLGALASGDSGANGELRQDVVFTGQGSGGTGWRNGKLVGYADDGELGFESSYASIPNGEYRYERFVDVGYGILPVWASQSLPNNLIFNDSRITGAIPYSQPYDTNVCYFAHGVESVANTTTQQRVKAFIFTEGRRYFRQ